MAPIIFTFKKYVLLPLLHSLYFVITEKTLSLLYQTVYRFNTNAARLLPKKKRLLDEWAKKLESPKEPFAIAVTEPKSYAGLEMNAKCFSYASPKKEISSEESPQSTNDGGIVATRDFQEGDVVIPLPLLLLPNTSPSCQNDKAETETGECSNIMLNTEWSTTQCFGHDTVPFLLCPLSPDDRVSFSAMTAVGNTGGANVKLQWGTGNAGTKNSLETSTEEVAKVRVIFFFYRTLFTMIFMLVLDNLPVPTFFILNLAVYNTIILGACCVARYQRRRRTCGSSGRCIVSWRLPSFA